ncbi:hypothetical protein BJV82DRAFT_589372 [Fennellomyces sp. T-0311]|nr:hypothetical protein BJV82DRAFT_589372 [Fennellomyces sp. T-0311]
MTSGPCPFDRCGYKPYKNVQSHIQRAHPNEPLPDRIFTESVGTRQLGSRKRPPQSDNSEEPSQSEEIRETQKNSLREEKSFESPKDYGEFIVEDLHKFNALEKAIIRFTLDNELSHIQYERLVCILERARRSEEVISCRTWETVRERAKETVKKQNLDFKEYAIDVNTVKDFPENKQLLFQSSIGKQPTLYYRDIFDVSESIFSDPSFQNHIVLTPSKLYRGDERVYTEIHTGDWWNNAQEEIGKDKVVLSIMLSSDQTVIWENQRYKAWPVYIKLGNVPMSIRNKYSSRSARTLAYLPIIESKAYGKSDWFRIAKKAIFHHAMSVILEPFTKKNEFLMRGPMNLLYNCVPFLAAYTADYPEQCLLATTRQGDSTKCPCPRCTITKDLLHDPSSKHPCAKPRTNKDSKELYWEVKGAPNKSKAEDICKEHSIHPVYNAFWDLPRFDIHSALLADDLHQLGDVLGDHLMSFIEELIVNEHGNEALDTVTARARNLPRYRGLRHFENGILPSCLKNATYHELVDCMKCLLPCVYDLIPSQAAMCFRYFIDFWFLAAAKEHDETSLTFMEETLENYVQSSSIFIPLSPTGLNFPKQHALSKYVGDIREKGIICNYSTTQTENQHKFDAKKPAKRTNRQRSTFTGQAVEFISVRDALLVMTSSTKPFSDTSKFSNRITEHKFMSPDNGETTIDSLSENNLYKDLESIIEGYIDDVKLNRLGRKKRYNMPRVEVKKVKVFKELRVYDYDDEGDCYEDIIRANLNYRQSVRMDFVLYRIEDDNDAPIRVGQALMFFKMDYGEEELDLALIQDYPFKAVRHPTGSPVLQSPHSRYKGNRNVIDADRIERAAYVVPDYRTETSSPGQYEQYLLVQDIDQDCWRRFATNLPKKRGRPPKDTANRNDRQ